MKKVIALLLSLALVIEAVPVYAEGSETIYTDNLDEITIEVPEGTEDVNFTLKNLKTDEETDLGDSLDLSDIEDGKYELIFKGTLEDEGLEEKLEFIYDSTFPKIEFDDIPELTNQDVEVTYTITEDNLDKTEIKVNGEEAEELIFKEEGEYEISIKATDLLKHESEETISFEIDKTKPEISLTGQDDNNIVSSLSKLKVSVSDKNYEGVKIDVIKDGEIIKAIESKDSSASISGIDEGKSEDDKYQFVITATDKAGNFSEKTYEITLDNTAPSIDLNVEDGAFYNEDVTVEAKSSDEEAEITVKVNGRNLENPISEDGKYEVVATAKDKAGNTSSKTVNFTLDKTVPTITLNGDIEGFTKNLSEITITAKDDNFKDMTVEVFEGENLVKAFTDQEVSLDGIETKESDNTTYTIKAKATDEAGNVKEGEFIIVVDNKNPDIKFNVIDNAFYNKDITLKVDTNEENVKSIDITGTLNGKEISELGTLSDEGAYKIKAVITDIVGNGSEKEVSFILDKTKPEISLSGMNDDGFVKLLDELTVKVDDTNYENMAVTVVKQGNLREGIKEYETTEDALKIEDLDKRDVDNEEYVIIVTATDKAGNNETKEFHIFRDNVSPKISFNGAENNGIYNKDIDIKAVIQDGSEDISIMTITRNGDKLDGTAMDRHLTDEGKYIVTVKSVDKAGNTSEASIEFIIDKTDPIASITGLVSGTHYQQVPEATFDSNEKSTIYYSITLDGKEIYHGTSDKKINYSEFKMDGDYSITAYAVDEAGNKGTETGEKFVKDSTAPVITLSGIEQGSYNNSDRVLNITIDERYYDTNDVTIVINHDGQTETRIFNATEKVSTNSIDFTKDGLYAVAVSATDKAGNKAETKSISFTIDKTRPITTISGLNEGTHYISIPSTISEMNEQGQLYVAVTRDGEIVYEGSDVSKADFSIDGDYVITAYSLDLAGNRSNEVRYSVVKDSTAPVITLSGIEEGAYYNTDQILNIAITERYFDTNRVNVTIVRNGESSSVNFSSTGVNSEMPISFSTDGRYEITVSATDEAGNSATSKTISFVIDKTLPITALEGIEEGRHYQTVPAITGTANEDGIVYIRVTRDGTVVYEGENNRNLTFQNFTEDGDYEVTMYTIDLAKNKGEEVTIKFVKDSTAPVITLSGIEDKAISNIVDGINLRVVERYFNKANVEIALVRELNGRTVDVPVSMALTGETTDMIIPIESDGVYTLTVKAGDEAGNIAEEKTLTFTIDRTKPDIKILISKSENGYDDIIDLNVTIQDDFFENKEITLEKAGIGKVNYPYSDNFNDKGGERHYEDFQKIKDNDGTYTLRVKATDKGGNEAAEELTFIVDRFGSVFVVRQAPDEKYMQELSEPIVIEEINVGTTISYDLFIHRDSDTKSAEQVNVSKKDNVTTYSVPTINFKDEGIYRIDLITRDSAGNVSELKSDTNSGIWFAIDKTAPIITYNGLTPGETYTADSMTLYIDAQDTISPDVQMKAWVNGKTAEIKEDRGGKQYITVNSGTNRIIEINATDTAGNKAVEIIDDITITTNPIVKAYTNKPLLAGLVMAAFALIGGIVFLIAKKKDQEEGTDDIEF